MVFLVVVPGMSLRYDDTRLASKMLVSVRVGQTDQCRYRKKEEPRTLIWLRSYCRRVPAPVDSPRLHESQVGVLDNRCKMDTTGT
jgi:hypothetical protein